MSTKRGCSIEDCERTHSCRGFCDTHYRRFRKHGDPNFTTIFHGPAHERVLRNCIRSATGCLEYQGKARSSKGGHGRVAIWINGEFKLKQAHRVVWENANGPIPEGLVVRHKCDNPICVEVRHLLLGTIADNNRDRDERGRRRAPFGSSASTSKLSEWQVVEIRRRSAAGEKQRSIAADFGMSQAAIWSAIKGKTWSHVTEIRIEPTP